jgi:hypothetical protein
MAILKKTKKFPGEVAVAARRQMRSEKYPRSEAALNAAQLDELALSGCRLDSVQPSTKESIPMSDTVCPLCSGSAE